MILVMTPNDVWLDSMREEILAWHRSQGINPDDTYKVVIDVQAMVAKVFQHKRNTDGQFYYDPTIDDIAARDPWDRKITSLPPGGFIEKF